MTNMRLAWALLRRVVVSLLILAGVQPALGQDDAPKPWVGGMGITETVDEIMARAALEPPIVGLQLTGKPKRIMPDTSGLPMDPNSPATATWPPTDNPPVIVPPYVGRSPQVIGVNFLAVDDGESGFIPPDTCGDVGPTQILIALNGRIKLMTKAGAVGALNASSNTFFDTVRNASNVVDPHVVYDRTSSRWFVLGINVTTPNRIVLAVSSGPTITGAASFTFFQFQQDLVGTTPNDDTGDFADYPSMGVDANAVTTGCNMFDGTTGLFTGVTGWVIRKSSVLAAGPIVVTAFRAMADASPSVEGPLAARGVTNDNPAATESYFIGPSTTLFGRLIVRRILTPGATPTLSANIVITPPNFFNPENVPALGSTILIEAGDRRLFDARMHLNRVTGTYFLWTAHSTEVNTTGVADQAGGRNGARWYQIQNMTTTPAVLMSGTLFHNAASNPDSYIYPTCAMTGQGHMALGASIGGAAREMEIAVAGRWRTDGAGLIQAATIAQASTTTYTVDFGSGRNRWGDYSSTIIDPADDQTMWSIQEFCNATNSWGVQVTQLRAPVPVTPSLCTPNTVAQGAAGVNLVVTGTSVAQSAFYDTDATYPNRIAASFSGTGITVNSVIRNSDTQVTINVTVAAAATLGARNITVTNPDAQAATGNSLLTVTGGCTAPAITTQPVALTRCVGTSATFTVAASGTAPLAFQWQKNAVNIGGATSSSFTIASVVLGDAGSFRCVVTNACGSATSNAAVLTVTTAPAITTQPVSIARCPGVSASFSVVASGTPAPTFQWQKNAVNIAGATAATFTIASPVAADAGTFRCIVTNSCGSVTSSDAVLTMNTLPAITTQPVSITRCPGVSASFTVAASGIPAPTFQWQKNTVNIAGATSATFTIASPVAADAGTFRCIVTNACGSATSANAVLTMNTLPSITTQPVSISRCPGTSASFTVVASGTPAPTFQWQKNAVNIAGATSATFTIASTVAADAGSFRCVVTNTCGSVTSNAAVLTMNTVPAITTQPVAITRCPGTSASFTVVASGTPAPTFQWQKNTVNIAGATAATFTIPSVVAADAGSFRCVVTNTCGSVTSNAVALTVSSGPVFTTHPTNQTVASGSSASFNAAASGTAPVSLQWRRNSVNLVNGGAISGATTGTLTINPATSANAGSYDCLATNACGSIDSNNATLTITGCIADVDDGTGTGTPDGGVTLEDLLYYLFLFDNGLIAADVDDGTGTGTPDGGVTLEDLLYFLARFDAGC